MVESGEVGILLIYVRNFVLQQLIQQRISALLKQWWTCYKQWHVRLLLHVPICTPSLNFCCLTPGSEVDHYETNHQPQQRCRFCINTGPQSDYKGENYIVRCFKWTIPYSLFHPQMQKKKQQQQQLASSPWARSVFCKQSLRFFTPDTVWPCSAIFSAPQDGAWTHELQQLAHTLIVVN